MNDAIGPLPEPDFIYEASGARCWMLKDDMHLWSTYAGWRLSPTRSRTEIDITEAEAIELLSAKALVHDLIDTMTKERPAASAD